MPRRFSVSVRVPIVACFTGTGSRRYPNHLGTRLIRRHTPCRAWSTKQLQPHPLVHLVNEETARTTQHFVTLLWRLIVCIVIIVLLVYPFLLLPYFDRFVLLKKWTRLFHTDACRPDAA